MIEDAPESFALEDLLATNLEIVAKQRISGPAEPGGDEADPIAGEILVFDSATGKGIVDCAEGAIDVDLSHTALLNRGYVALRPGSKVEMRLPQDRERFARTLKVVS